MARLCLPVGPRDVRVLDPGAGMGILGLAVAVELLETNACRTVHLVAVEAEPHAREVLRDVLAAASRLVGPRLRTELVAQDFLDLQRGDLPSFHVAISNPPYVKRRPRDEKGGTAPNSYARFMGVALELLGDGGALCFLVPRSFASGAYFRAFRERFHARAGLEHAHVFASRREVFADQAVLQENVIVRYRKGPPSAEVAISTGEHSSQVSPIRVARAQVMRRAGDDTIVCLPTSEEDLAVLGTVGRWPCTLADYGLAVRTGPVVPFRATGLLRSQAQASTVPLLWMSHVRAGAVRWPLGAAFRKDEHIDGGAGPLLVPNQTYVLMRRLSAKEEPRRITCAVVREDQLPGDVIGLENHLNYVHRPAGALDLDEAHGLCAILGSTPMDRFFRISSGNTQVSATEVRGLPLPPPEVTRAVGRSVRGGTSPDDAVARALSPI